MGNAVPRGSWVAAMAIVGIACASGAVPAQSGSRTTAAASDEREPAAPPTTGATAVPASEAVPVPDPAPVADPAPQPEPAPVLDPLTVSTARSTSIGGPANGSVTGAIPLPERAPGLVSNPNRPNPTAYYGTVELVRALVRAAAVVDRELPGSAVVINDIGLPEGGPIPHHGSHQAGRDVDVLFYYLDARGEPWPAKGVPIDPRGRGWDFADLSVPDDDVRVRLDAPRTWRFVQALLEDDLSGQGAQVQRIFLAEHVRALLLAEAESVGAPRAVRDRFGALTCQPGYPHDDHLHIRFFCSDEDLQAGCADGPPMYPWRRQQLREAGIEPVRATRAPRDRRAPITTEEEAREEARATSASTGRLHARVRAFLAERETWSTPPHPGRPFCR